MHFALLAPEIILLLIPFLQMHEVARLSRTCKWLRSIVLSKLYKTIHWRWNTGAEQYPKVLVSLPIHLLLRS